MKTYTVTVRTLNQIVTYQAIGTDSAAVHLAALERFGHAELSRTTRID